MSDVDFPAALASEVAASWMEWTEKMDVSISETAIVPFSHLPVVQGFIKGFRDKRLIAPPYGSKFPRSFGDPGKEG